MTSLAGYSAALKSAKLLRFPDRPPLRVKRRHQEDTHSPGSPPGLSHTGTYCPPALGRAAS